MRIDFYTKLVLTIIAACLVWLVVGGVHEPVAYAQRKSPPSLITGAEFGYRVDQWTPGAAPQGTLVVNIDGLWYEAKVNYVKK